MLAAKLFEPGDIRVVECAVPEIGPGELLLKTGAAAICGTDLRMAKNGLRGVDKQHPLTLGHELAGEITAVGEKVAGFAPGMRVAVAPNMGCGVCDACVAGDTHLCPDYRALGINMDGAFAEYVRIPAQAVTQGNILALEEGISFAEAAVLEPLSCVLNGQEIAGVELNDTVLIIGAGPIGILHALLARAAGAARIFIRDLSPARMDQCAEIVPGAVPVTGDNLREEIMALTGGRGVDLCITACPSGAMQAESLHLTAVNGRILFFGGLPAGGDAVTLDTNQIHYKQLRIHGSTRASVGQFRRAVKLAGTGNLPLSQVVSARFALADFSEALAYAGSAQGLKTVITFDWAQEARDGQ